MKATLTGQGINYEKLEDHDQILKYYENAINKFQSINDTERAGIVHSLIANTYESQGAWEDAIQDYQKSTQIFNKIGDKKRLNEINNRKKDIKTKRGKKDQAA